MTHLLTLRNNFRDSTRSEMSLIELNMETSTG